MRWTELLLFLFSPFPSLLFLPVCSVSSSASLLLPASKSSKDSPCTQRSFLPSGHAISLASVSANIWNIERKKFHCGRSSLNFQNALVKGTISYSDTSTYFTLNVYGTHIYIHI